LLDPECVIGVLYARRARSRKCDNSILRSKQLLDAGINILP
jgi:hypothetical protein